MAAGLLSSTTRVAASPATLTQVPRPAHRREGATAHPSTYDYIVVGAGFGRRRRGRALERGSGRFGAAAGGRRRRPARRGAPAATMADAGGHRARLGLHQRRRARIPGTCTTSPVAGASAARTPSTRWPSCAATTPTSTPGRTPATPGWSYAEVLPYFKRLEDVPQGDPRYRGRGGPLAIAPTAHPHPLSLAFVEACQQAGQPRLDDFNLLERDGAGLHDMTIVGGQRQTTADAYCARCFRGPT